MTKLAAQKTAGVLGDDLALNAQQVSGVRAERELPVVWGVAKGSLVNKLILVPAALIISTLAPKLITPLLMIGGAYLCYEGAEKIFHRLTHTKKTGNQKSGDQFEDIDLAALEKQKIKGAVRTDFVLSAEIVVIALGTIPEGASLAVRSGTLALIGLLMTAGVYGLVAGIVKLDDAGFWLIRKNEKGGILKKLGTMMVGAAPYLMRFLTVAGTTAMFLVGGSILAHGLPLPGFIHHLAALPPTWLWPHLADAICGLVAGAILLPVVSLARQAVAVVKRRQ